jgi:hypothetical protein
MERMQTPDDAWNAQDVDGVAVFTSGLQWSSGRGSRRRAERAVSEPGLRTRTHVIRQWNMAPSG